MNSQENQEKNMPNEIIKYKRDLFRVEIRKKDILSKMLANRLNQFNSKTQSQNQTDSPTNQFQQGIAANKVKQSYKNIIPYLVQQDKSKMKQYINQVCAEFKKEYENFDSKQPYKLEESLIKLKRALVQGDNEIQLYALENNIHQLFYNILSDQFQLYQDIQYQVGWIIGNMLQKPFEYWSTLVKQDDRIVDLFINYFKSDNEKWREIGILGLGNMCNEYIEVRNKAIEEGCLDHLIKLFCQKYDSTSFSDYGWLMVCFTYRPHPYDEVKKLYPIIDMLLGMPNASCLSEALSALAYLTDGDNYRISDAINMKNFKEILKLTQSEVTTLIIPAVRVLCNCCSGDDSQVEILLNMGVLDVLSIMLDKIISQVRHEACWALSNLMYSTPKIIQQILDHKDILQKVAKLYLVEDLNSQQAEQLVNLGVIDILFSVFDIQEPDSLKLALDGFHQLFYHGIQIMKERNLECNPIQSIFDNKNIVSHLQVLEQHPAKEVNEIASSILQEFYQKE